MFSQVHVCTPDTGPRSFPDCTPVSDPRSFLGEVPPSPLTSSVTSPVSGCAGGIPSRTGVPSSPSTRVPLSTRASDATPRLGGTLLAVKQDFLVSVAKTLCE